jgi:hypothetical protein
MRRLPTPQTVTIIGNEIWGEDLRRLGSFHPTRKIAWDKWLGDPTDT